MKIIIAMITLVLLAGSVQAANLNDVALLSLKPKKESFELKLRVKEAKENSYFLVEIGKDDEHALEKLSLVLKKLHLKNSFKLNLTIPSFSVSPSGSYYKSNYVQFSGSSEEPVEIRP